ncbi:MAG: GNAT family N-acetyltransferase [Pseudomonadota bacterium]
MLEDTTTKRGDAALAAGASRASNRPAPGFHEEFVVSQAASPRDLTLLLDSLSREDSAHSWKNFDRTAGLEDLLRWENSRRPTEVFFFHLKRGDDLQIVGTGSVAEYLNSRFDDPGVPVLGRCYILPEFRGRGIYRRVLQFRFERCIARLGHKLKGVHIGSDDERIAHVIAQPSPHWPRFHHLGEEALPIAGQTKLVNAYISLLPGFSRSLAQALEGQGAPPALAALHRRLTGTEPADARNLGIELRDALDGAQERAWLSQRDCGPIDQLMAFCRAVPLVGFE